MTSDGSFFMTPHEIYERITGGPGAMALAATQDATLFEWRQESDRAERIRDLAATIRSGWQGDASIAAYGAAMPLADMALQGAHELQNAHDFLIQQSESFHRAANDVRPVPAQPPENSLDDRFPFDVDHDKDVTSYQADVQHNIQVFRGYDDASQYNETNMPQEYHTTQRSSGDVAVKAPADTIEVGDPGEPRNGGPGDSGAPRDSGAYSDNPYPGGPSTGSYLPGPGGLQTSPSEYRPAPVSSYSLPPSDYPTPGQHVSAAPGGFVGGVPVSGYPGGGGTGGVGPRSSGGGGSPGGPGAVRGVAPRVGAGALAAEEAAARRAGQAAAAGGARPGGAGPMGAPVGAGRGKDDEDTEHQRKVLIESDAEGTFGSDVLTAPQVIGDDEYED